MEGFRVRRNLFGKSILQEWDGTIQEWTDVPYSTAPRKLICSGDAFKTIKNLEIDVEHLETQLDMLKNLKMLPPFNKSERELLEIIRKNVIASLEHSTYSKPDKENLVKNLERDIGYLIHKTKERENEYNI